MNRVLAAAALGAVLLGSTACGGDDAVDSPQEGTTAVESFTAQVASYDLAANAPQRFIVGLLAGEGGLIVGGSVEMRFQYLGSDPSKPLPETDVAPIDGVEAHFLPVADGAAASSGPKPREGDEGVGVYEANDLRFPKAGYWGVQVKADYAGKEQTAEAAFEVQGAAQLPAVGDPAPRTVNLLPGATDAPAKAVDSRAADDGSVPDPQLHRLTVEQALATGKPTMVVVSTPVFCVSRFCGPITDSVDKMAADYGERANFVHIEVWRDFEGKVINKAAAEWIWPNQSVDAREPWVFLVDAGGSIVGRWDNVANGANLRAALDRLT